MRTKRNELEVSTADERDEGPGEQAACEARSAEQVVCLNMKYDDRGYEESRNWRLSRSDPDETDRE